MKQRNGLEDSAIFQPGHLYSTYWFQLRRRCFRKEMLGTNSTAMLVDNLQQIVKEHDLCVKLGSTELALPWF